MTQHLFVYGLLRRGFANPMARLLQVNGRMIGEGVLEARLFDLGAYPAAVEAEKGTAGVIGEVYALSRPDYVLRALDRFEGCAAGDPEPHLYVREAREIALDAGGSTTAWVYLYNRETRGLTAIPGGDYARYRLAGRRPRTNRA
ncbi:MAG: gamma-glutamylcyclotransferase family protein [Methyloligellaceae bacterium]